MMLMSVVLAEAPFFNVNTPLKTLTQEYIDAQLRREAISTAK